MSQVRNNCQKEGLDRSLLYNVIVRTKLKSNNNVVYSFKLHIVWCVKYRRKALEGDIARRLETILRQVCLERNVEIISIEIMPDRCHLLVEVDPQFGGHRLVKLLKGRSSRYLRQEFESLRTRLPSLWTNSYFVSTVGGAPLSVINQYIEDQKSV